MALKQQNRCSLLALMLLLSTTAMAQTPYPVRYDDSTMTDRSLLRDSVLSLPALRVPVRINFGIQRSECVWRRATSYPPSPMNVQEQVGRARMEMAHSRLSEAEKRAELERVRKSAEQTRDGWTHTTEFRLQWDGERTRHAALDQAMLPDVAYYDSEKSVILENLSKETHYAWAHIRPLGGTAYSYVDTTEGMATLLKGVPISTVIADATFRWVEQTGASANIQIQREKLFSPLSGNQNAPRTMDMGDLRLTLNNKTGRIERIVTLRTQSEEIVTSIVPSGYRIFPGGFQLPQKIVVTHYGSRQVLSTEVFTLLSAKFNDELDPNFLRGPLFASNTRVADYRLGGKPLEYTARDFPLSLEQLRQQDMRTKTRQYVPLVVLLQIPLITAIILRRRKKALKNPFARS